MELRQLRYFAAVADELHFRRAGLKLRVAQPALSLQIQNLESELGTLLFERTNRRVQLTPSGSLLREHCRTIFAAIEHATNDVQAVSTGESGVLRFGFTSTASYTILPDFVKDLSRAYPKVQTELEEHPAAELFKLLEERRLDLVFVQATFIPSHLQSCRVAHEKFIVVLSKHHALARKGQVRPRDLLDELMFLPDQSHSQALHEGIVNIFTKEDSLPKRTQIVEQVQTAIVLASTGLGVVLVPESARSFVPAGAALLSLPPTARGIDLFAVWRRNDFSPLLNNARTLLPRR